MGQLGLVPGDGGGSELEATLWVDAATGNDSNTIAAVRAGAGSVKWATIGRAAWGSTNRSSPNSAQAAVAGDVVAITAGAYSAPGGGDRFEVTYNPANEGTNGNPITFYALGTVTLTHTSSVGPVIGASSKDYIHWVGPFTATEVGAPSTSDTGQCVFFDCNGCMVDGAILTGDPAWTEREGDNYPAIRIEDGPNTTVRNCVLTDYGGETSGGGDENHAGIETYRSFPLTVEHNHFVNCASGIYLKAVNTESFFVDDTIVRYNIFENNRNGIRILRYPQTSSDPCLIHQNVFEDNDRGIAIVRFGDGTTDPTHIKTFNNTFYNNDVGYSVGQSSTALNDNAGCIFWNNICMNDGYHVEVQSTSVATTLEEDRLSAEHNVYRTPDTNFSELGGSGVSLATWKATYSKDSVSPAAITSDPLFVSAGTDFHLQGGSPALTQGRAVHGVGGSDGTTIPAGCYITGSETIGPE